MKLLFENWKRYLAEVEVDAPAPPEPSICDPDDEPIDFIGVLDAAISIVAEAGKPELAHVLQCLQQQIVPASEYEGGGEEDERPRPAFGSPLEKGGPVGFQEALLVLKEGGLAGHYTEPRHEGGTPEERLLNKLLIRSKIDQAGDPQRAAAELGLGDDEEVIAYLANLMGNPMLDNPNMEEAIQSGGKPSKPADQHSEVSYDPTKLTRKTFHKKARKVAKQDIKKGEIEEAASTAAQRDKKRDAAARKRREEREKDPTYQKVKAATEKHLEKAKKER